MTLEALNTLLKSIKILFLRYYTKEEFDIKLQEKANVIHNHTINDIDELKTTLTNTASAITINANSISAHSTAISSLQTIVNDIQEISSEEIQALFNA